MKRVVEAALCDRFAAIRQPETGALMLVERVAMNYAKGWLWKFDVYNENGPYGAQRSHWATEWVNRSQSEESP